MVTKAQKAILSKKAVLAREIAFVHTELMHGQDDTRKIELKLEAASLYAQYNALPNIVVQVRVCFYHGNGSLMFENHVMSSRPDYIADAVARACNGKDCTNIDVEANVVDVLIDGASMRNANGQV